VRDDGVEAILRAVRDHLDLDGDLLEDVHDDRVLLWGFGDQGFPFAWMDVRDDLGLFGREGRVGGRIGWFLCERAKEREKYKEGEGEGEREREEWRKR
jgi:hypothetical protein